MPITVQELINRRRIRQAGRFRFRKPPRQAYPHSEQREYQRELSKISKTLSELLERIVIPRLASISRQAQADRPIQTTDAWDDEVTRAVSAIRIGYEREWTEAELKSLARRRGISISAFNRRAVQNQFRAVLGVDPFIAEPWLTNELGAFVSQNVGLIKSVPEKFFSEIESLIFTGLRAGERWESIADSLRERIGVSESNFDRIARDQTSKLNGQMTMLRQTQLGVTQYEWLTSGDERVRESHAAKNGKTFSWENPPSDTGHPGEDINCRCIASPIMLSVLETEDE